MSDRDELRFSPNGSEVNADLGAVLAFLLDVGEGHPPLGQHGAQHRSAGTRNTAAKWNRQKSHW